MKTININNKNYTIEELTKILEDAKKSSPMDKVFAYHGTTEEEFNNLYAKIPLRSKYYEIEAMIVAYKNNGWEYKEGDRIHYPYFNLSPFCFHYSGWFESDSHVPLALCFKNDELLKEAVEEFEEQYKLSRTTL